MRARKPDSGKDKLLREYRTRRDFRHTPEPDGDPPVTAGQRYVMQKHWARRLHYDLRLEVSGVMKSWAVPKGPSLDPADKRLAIQVEDHPIAYNNFEGHIPKGQYGAGRVIIWDRGTWIADGDAAAGLEAGHLKFELDGEKLAGRWSLVRMKGGENDRARQPPWLLIKERDDAARSDKGFDVTEAMPDSVATGKAEARKARKPAPQHQTLPDRLTPQLVQLVSQPPQQSSGWQWELKFDGYRLLTRIGPRGGVRLFTRNGLDWSDRMPELVAAIAAQDMTACWLDGEVIMPGDDDVPDFAALQQAFSAQRSAGLVYYLFDAPFLQGIDLRGQPLKERRKRLEAALPALPPSGPLRLSPILEADAASLLVSACKMGLEGIIGKKRDSIYRSRRSADWIKLKCGQEDEFVIVGMTAGQGARAASRDLGALVLAAHDADGRLRWAGNAGTGFSAATLAQLKTRLKPLQQATSPLTPMPKMASAVQWVRPELVAQIKHAGMTPRGRVRQAVFRGLREDKTPKEVCMPTDGADATDTIMKKEARAPVSKQGKKIAKLAGRKLTHPDRVTDGTSGTTKLDLARYYASACPLVLPHLAGRPVALVRAPEGVDGQTFFQKHAKDQQLPGMTMLDPELDPGHASLLEVSSEAALLGAAQMGMIELHTWNARADLIERPDRFVLDLDPGEGVTWPQVREAAELVRTLISELGLVPFIKTSGGVGLHIVTPIKRLYDWDGVKEFSRQLTEHLARVMPDRFSAVSGPKNRVGRIFADYLRNGRGATTVAAWSARARAGMGISVPFGWDELTDVAGGAHWHINNIHARLRVGNTPWNGYRDAARALGHARKTMGRLAS